MLAWLLRKCRAAEDHAGTAPEKRSPARPRVPPRGADRAARPEPGRNRGYCRHQLALVHVFAPVLIGIVFVVVDLVVAPVSVLDLPHRVKARIDVCL